MFTGLIQSLGTLNGISPRDDGAVISISHTRWDVTLSVGESVAVQGVCLTVRSASGTRFECDVLSETLDRTNLGSKRTGASLNLERALRADERLGGHIVTGHIDGVGTVGEVRALGRDRAIRIECDHSVMSGIVEKGSVTCDGVSLTISAAYSRAFEVNLIPITLTDTSLSDLVAGNVVNIETDIIGKYVAKYMVEGHLESQGVDIDTLRNAGFA